MKTIVELLIANGADPYKKNKNNQTVFDLCKGDASFIALLQKEENEKGNYPQSSKKESSDFNQQAAEDTQKPSRKISNEQGMNQNVDNSGYYNKNSTRGNYYQDNQSYQQGGRPQRSNQNQYNQMKPQKEYRQPGSQTSFQEGSTDMSFKGSMRSGGNSSQGTPRDLMKGMQPSLPMDISTFFTNGGQYNGNFTGFTTQPQGYPFPGQYPQPQGQFYPMMNAQPNIYQGANVIPAQKPRTREFQKYRFDMRDPQQMHDLKFIADVKNLFEKVLTLLLFAQNESFQFKIQENKKKLEALVAVEYDLVIIYPRISLIEHSTK